MPMMGRGRQGMRPPRQPRIQPFPFPGQPQSPRPQGGMNQGDLLRNYIMNASGLNGMGQEQQQQRAVPNPFIPRQMAPLPPGHMAPVPGPPMVGVPPPPLPPGMGGIGDSPAPPPYPPGGPWQPMPFYQPPPPPVAPYGSGFVGY